VKACPYELPVNGALFVGARPPLSPRIGAAAMAGLRGRLGLPDTATPHALSAFLCDASLARGGDLRAIQELLGHASLSTTQIYTAVDAERLLESTAAPIRAHDRIVTAGGGSSIPSAQPTQIKYIVTGRCGGSEARNRAARACELQNRDTSDQGERS